MQLDLGTHRRGLSLWLPIIPALWLLYAAISGAAPASEPFTGDGYRTAPYRAPTPLEINEATTLHFAQDVRRLLENGAAVGINVSPITLGPRLDDGTRPWLVRPDRPLRHIPGTVWLPNVGLAELDGLLFRYFESNLRRLSDGNTERGFLFYCQADCWMSWNAVRRASRELGYRNIYWYPFGIDGWREAGYPVEVAHPVPVPADVTSMALPPSRGEA